VLVCYCCCARFWRARVYHQCADTEQVEPITGRIGPMVVWLDGGRRRVPLRRLWVPAPPPARARERGYISLGVVSEMDSSLHRPCHSLHYFLPPNEPPTTRALFPPCYTTPLSTSAAMVSFAMTDRWTASTTPAPTAADEDNKNKLQVLAEMVSKVSPHVSLTHAVQPAQDKMAAVTYNSAILTQTRASIKALANSSAQTSYLQPPRMLPGHMQQTPSVGTCNLEDEVRAEAAPHLRLEKRSGKAAPPTCALHDQGCGGAAPLVGAGLWLRHQDPVAAPWRRQSSHAERRANVGRFDGRSRQCGGCRPDEQWCASASCRAVGLCCPCGRYRCCSAWRCH